MKQIFFCALLTVASAGCATQQVLRSTLTAPPSPLQSAELWEEPVNMAGQDLFDGPWGKALAPNPAGTYTLVSVKTKGVSPGFAVTDEQGVEWSIKQGTEASVEVVTSRILSAVGYHQPPVYYLPRWNIVGGRLFGVTGAQAEGRFRPKHAGLKDEGEWSWQENPFVGTRPYNGLRVLMMILNESDLKNDNNSIYEVKETGDAKKHRWYVVRDIGTALGDTERLNPDRNNPALFQKTRFIDGVENGVVTFNYRGRHRELAGNITPDDVRWICNLLARLSMEQWHDAFRAAGYDTATSDQFITRIREKIAEGQAL